MGYPGARLWLQFLGFCASLCLSDSSGSTPLLDPRFSPSSPPAVRSNRQGRGAWVDTLGAGSVFRLLLSNVSIETTPHPHPDIHRTHAHISHFLERDGPWMERQALLLWLGAPHWTAGDTGKGDAAKGVWWTQGWTRPEVAPIPAADHLPIICNYLHLYTTEINTRTHTYTLIYHWDQHTHIHTHTITLTDIVSCNYFNVFLYCLSIANYIVQQQQFAQTALILLLLTKGSNEINHVYVLLTVGKGEYQKIP